MLFSREDRVAELQWSFGFWGHQLTRPRKKVEVSDAGVTTWWLDDCLHREDGPAVEWPDGTRQWWREGKLHRDDGPAVERADGSRMWFRSGKLHREDGPAVIDAGGAAQWWRNGILLSTATLSTLTH
jgi:hypothetical protein